MNKKLLGILLILSLYPISLLSIYLLAPDPNTGNFPSRCPETPNCTRVADINVRGYGLSPLTFNTSLSSLHDAVVQWINDQPRTTVLADNGTFIHAKFLTAFFRFPDDFYLFLFCQNNSATLWVQSQSRLGKSDLNVNEDRVQAFFSYLSTLSLPQQDCS